MKITLFSIVPLFGVDIYHVLPDHEFRLWAHPSFFAFSF